MDTTQDGLHPGPKAHKQYSEKEINEIIDFSHSFNDTPLLRRELISQKFLDRKDDGSVYWRIN